MTWYVWPLLGLLVAEAAGTAVFTWLYWRGSEWRTSTIGRHLLAYSAALSALYVATFLAMTWPRWPSIAALLAAHAAFNVAVWHRVVLVVRAQHRQE
jgi:hypothetical protein